MFAISCLGAGPEQLLEIATRYVLISSAFWVAAGIVLLFLGCTLLRSGDHVKKISGVDSGVVAVAYLIGRVAGLLLIALSVSIFADSISSLAVPEYSAVNSLAATLKGAR